jgi:hypothetical protein
VPEASEVTETERIAAAQAYIDALVTHDGDAVPFASDCTRVEQGMKNGFSGKHLRRSLTRGPQYKVIGATTTPEYTVSGDETFVIPAGAPSGQAEIHHIRVRFHPFLHKG